MLFINRGKIPKFIKLFFCESSNFTFIFSFINHSIFSKNKLSEEIDKKFVIIERENEEFNKIVSECEKNLKIISEI